MKANRFPARWMFCPSLAFFFAAAFLTQTCPGANFYQGVASNTVSWPGGIVPYVFATNVTTSEQAIYLAGMREWELAANIHFTNRTTQTNYVLLQFDYTQGTDTFVASFPEAVMTVDTLQRSQVAHETGHLLGFQHEHVRNDRNTYITVNFSNLVSSGDGGTNGSGEGSNISSLYQIDTNSTSYGAYDFQSVMHYSRTLFSIDPATLDVLVPNAPYFTEYYYRIGNYALSPGDRAGAAYLYGPPTTPITNIVTNTADVGLGSLRAAIYYANDHPGTTISFNIPTNDPGYSNGVYTIYTSGQLPPLVANGTVIDATTQPGYVNHPIVAIDGSKLSPELAYPGDFFVSGLYIFAANCVINGLAINNFNFVGIDVEYALAISNRIEGCYIGISPNGTNAAPNTYQGISIDTGASYNFVGGTNATNRNVISGNTQYGVLIIGTNGLYGASVIGSNVNNNTVLGNYIGLNGAGTAALGNLKSGVGIWGGASSNVIGGLTSGSRNVISGNTEYGVYISDSNTVGTLIEGNYIGSDVTGTTGVPNTNSGIGIYSGANNVLVGGTSSGARNLISGNSSAGVLIGGTAVSNTIQGNYVGVASNGTSALPNQQMGIYLLSGPQSNLIGGTIAGAGNLISGNVGYGIQFYGAGTSFNLVEGNSIGTASNGTTALPNTIAGVYIEFANSNTIGGAVAGAGNVISGNSGDGVQLYGDSASLNTIQGNYVGLASNGTSALPNTGIGIYVEFANSNTIGGTVAGAGNVVSANGNDGVQIYDGSYNIVQGNLVGTDKTGSHALGNSGSALSAFDGATFNTIGGASASARNILTASTNYDGVYLSAASNNVVEGNYIGTDSSGLIAFTNGLYGYGLTLFGASQANQVLSNVIAASLNQGIYISDPGTTGNLIQGNNIGVGSDGATALGNGQQGIAINNDASNNVIGLTVAGSGTGNIIAHSAYEGIVIYTNSTGNTIRGNTIFSNGRIGLNLSGGTENGYLVTSNHVGGAVPGPNDLQNYPVITSASVTGSTTTISGTLNSTSNRTFLVDVYRNASPDPSGYGQGQIYAGSTMLTTAGSGNGSFALAASGSFTGQYFTVTATDTTTGDTSEFGFDVAATNGPVPPSFTGPYLYNSNGFSFRLSLNSNENYILQAATNLATNPVVWTTLTNTTATNAVVQFTDHSATNPAIRQRFYRAYTP